MQHTIEKSPFMHKTGMYNIRKLLRHFKKLLTNASSDCVADVVNLDKKTPSAGLPAAALIQLHITGRTLHMLNL